MTEDNAEVLTILIDLFIEKATEWSEVIHTISCLDVLRSFAISASLSAGSMARPVIFPESKSTIQNQETNGPMLKIRGLWHPFAVAADGQLPVPNDLLLGEATSSSFYPRSLLLTGPNMGGKSTLLRATCLAVIFAQVCINTHHCFLYMSSTFSFLFSVCSLVVTCLVRHVNSPS